LRVSEQEELPPRKYVVDVLHCKTNSCSGIIKFCSQVLGALLRADGTVRTMEELQEYNRQRVSPSQQCAANAKGEVSSICHELPWFIRGRAKSLLGRGSERDACMLVVFLGCCVQLC
jgi:hypothetical protein